MTSTKWPKTAQLTYVTDRKTFNEIDYEMERDSIECKERRAEGTEIAANATKNRKCEGTRAL